MTSVTPMPKGESSPPIRSAVCQLSAETGNLAYRGYDVRDLAAQASYEETAYLLVHGHLPTRFELKDFLALLRSQQKLSPPMLKAIGSAPAGAEAVSVLRLALAAGALEQPIPMPPAPAQAMEQGVRLIARTPTIVAAFHRLRSGRRPMTPKKSLTFAANTLYQLRGEPADEESIRALEVALILRADNELNPSTFAARVTASTGADMYSCILAALSALSGPRHGWHTRQVLKALEEIGTPEQVPAWVRSRLEMRAKIPGFGHQVYQGEDPRTGTLRSLAERHCERAGILPLYRTARALEEAVVREAGQYPIVDFYLTPLYRALGLPADLFTAIFAVSRMCGWVAHALEQSRDENLIRPRAEYTGPEGLLYIPVRRRK